MQKSLGDKQERGPRKKVVFKTSPQESPVFSLKKKSFQERELAVVGGGQVQSDSMVYTIYPGVMEGIMKCLLLRSKHRAVVHEAYPARISMGCC